MKTKANLLVGSLFTAANLAAMSQPAMAYVGPGAGLSAIGSVLGFLGVLFLVVVGFFWYPVKRLLGRGRQVPAGGADELAAETPQDR